ncbi:MAG: PTS transporter subunit EIIC [Bacilli bacterium]|nr:PTS transporter subunit EIIC [Bacilli bacterium]
MASKPGSNKPLSEFELARLILHAAGGVTNILDVSNCMTRLRLTVKDPSVVRIADIKRTPGVLGLINDGPLFQVVLGPGVVRKVADEFTDLIKASAAVAREVYKSEKKTDQKPITGNSFVRFFKRIGRFLKNVQWKRGLRHVGNVFSPLVPGFIVFGICYSITVIIQTSVLGPGGKPTDLTGAAGAFYWLFYAISFGFLSYLSIFVGINSAKEFGATPTIGGMLGGLAIVPEILELAKIIGWAGDPGAGDYPLSLIASGRGGVFTVILTVFIISFIEKAIRKKMPNVLDTVFSPLLTITIGGVLLLFVIMPAMGFVSNGITTAIGGFQTLSPFLKALCGIFLAGLYLPLIMLGLHHGFTTIYTTPEMMANNILYPMFAMNDAAQCGVGIAIYLKARKYKHNRLRENAAAGIIPQALGVSEPLIYGVTLPLFKPFITVAIGAAIGGAFIAGMGLGFNGFDVSGLLGVMLASKLNGVDAPIMARVVYLSGWFLSAGISFLATWFMISEKDLNKMPRYDTFVNKPITD